MINQTKTGNPFVGLRAFEEDEDYLFFGRNKEIKDLLMKFAGSRFLAVIGSSGSGKSSLVKSGLLPAIHSGFLSSGHNWHVAVMRPENKPLENLALALSKKGVLNTTEETIDGIPYLPIIESTLRRSTNGLIEVYNQSSIYNKNKSLQPENLLVIVDQFEELFRFSKEEKEINKGESQSLNFVNLLLNATAEMQAQFPIYVLITMRSDFLGDCSQFRRLPEVINNGQYLVPRMTRDEIKEAITGPIAIGGAQITQSLITRLLNDVGNDIDQLPILQHAMMRTWDAWARRNQPGDPINLNDYLSIGGMDKALSDHANEVYDKLSPGENKKYCELMFKALTDKAADIRGIRRPRSISDLTMLIETSPENVISIVEEFREPGRTFLMPPYPVPLDNSSVIDISHESLMRIWDKLKVWADEEAQSAEVFRRLAEASKREAVGEAILWSGPELAMGLKWREKFKNDNELIKIWALPFVKDNKKTEQALDFLKRSNEQAIAFEEQEKRRIKEEHERNEAEANRRREEEEKEKKNKRRTNYFVIALVVLGLIIIGTVLSLKEVNNQKNIAVKNADTARIAKNSAEYQKGIAVQNAEEARIAKDSAEYQKGIAVQNAEEARIAKDSAEYQKGIAIQNAKEARLAKDSAEYQKGIAIQNAEEARRLNLKNAASEYARLLQDGPSEENGNENTFYPANYFLAYTYHFNQLNSFLKNDSNAYGIYKSIKNKLYYDNELYERIYEDFGINKSMDEVIKKENKQSNKDDSIITRPKVKSKNGELNFYSTDDNYIYVDNKKLDRTDTIYMGAKVTALDFNDSRTIIYFGTSSGYIGYVEYSGAKKRSQPVFQNKLESEITAIRFFDYKDNPDSTVNHFLLAAAKTSNTKVYKLDANSLKPDKYLVGNELPYSKGFGDIRQAQFDKDKIILNTSNGIFVWNPFSYDLLSKLTQLKKFDPLSPRYNTEKIKIYK